MTRVAETIICERCKLPITESLCPRCGHENEMPKPPADDRVKETGP